MPFNKGGCVKTVESTLVASVSEMLGGGMCWLSQGSCLERGQPQAHTFRATGSHLRGQLGANSSLLHLCWPPPSGYHRRTFSIFWGRGVRPRRPRGHCVLSSVGQDGGDAES